MGGRKEERRLEGPIPEGVKDDLGPVEVTRPTGDRSSFRASLSILLIVVISIPFISWITWSTWSSGNRMDLVPPLIVLCVFTIIVPLLILLVRDAHKEMIGNRIILDTDRVRLLYNDRPLKDIPFNRDVRLDAFFNLSDDGSRPDEIGYAFAKGWYRIVFGTPEGVPKDDMDRMWPVIEAAAWKHRMVLGEGIIGPLTGGKKRDPFMDRWIERQDRADWPWLVVIIALIAATPLIFGPLLMAGEVVMLAIISVVYAIPLYVCYVMWSTEKRYKGASGRRFEMRLYEQLPMKQRPEGLAADLQAEPWGLRQIGNRRFHLLGQGFTKEFETREGSWLMMLGGWEHERFRPAFVLSPEAAGLKDEVERFAREKGWKEE
jgi:hypothetical protein